MTAQEVTSSTPGRAQNPGNHMFVILGSRDVRWLCHQSELGQREILRPALVFPRGGRDFRTSQ